VGRKLFPHKFSFCLSLSHPHTHTQASECVKFSAVSDVRLIPNSLDRLWAGDSPHSQTRSFCLCLSHTHIHAHQSAPNSVQSVVYGSSPTASMECGQDTLVYDKSAGGAVGGAVGGAGVTGRSPCRICVIIYCKISICIVYYMWLTT